MEGETDPQAESTQSGTTPAQGDTPPPHSCSSESSDLQEPSEAAEQRDVQAEASQLQVGEEERAREDTAKDPPLAPPPGADESQLPPAPSSPSNTPGGAAEPCWYCLRSLHAEYRPEAPRQENPDPLSTSPPSGQKVSYQTDPRPHFGVAWSSHSTCRPLWGSEGPCSGQRSGEVPEQMHCCPHCHLGLSPDTLRWHEAKCLVFEGGRNSKT